MTQENTLLNSTFTNLFFGEGGAGLSRHDVARYPVLDKMNDKMMSFFWKPQEIDMSQERMSFNKMTDAEQFVFTSNLRRQILLDSIQGRAPSLCFLPIATDPQLEACIQTWSFFEQLHSLSYGYILRAIYPDPEEVFTGIPAIAEIADCAQTIGVCYENLAVNPSKENLYLALISANALEAIRFYVSFACTFSFAERGLVNGSANIVKLIARDEAQHLALVQNILKLLPKDDPEFIQIAGDLKGVAANIFDEAAEQEKNWTKYLFQHGSILGLNSSILDSYVDMLNVKQKKSVLGIPGHKVDHPIPWIERWLSSKGTQEASQETEKTSYLIGSLINDVSDMELSL